MKGLAVLLTVAALICLTACDYTGTVDSETTTVVQPEPVESSAAAASESTAAMGATAAATTEGTASTARSAASIESADVPAATGASVAVTTGGTASISTSAARSSERATTGDTASDSVQGDIPENERVADGMSGAGDTDTQSVNGGGSDNYSKYASVNKNPVSDVFTLAFISDYGLLGDGSITQATWEGVAGYAAEHSMPVKHYSPKNQRVSAYLDTIGEAVADGAKLIITSGVLSEIPVWTAQSRYPDICFILVDGIPHNDEYSNETINNNVTVIRFNSAEAGFLAGYAAVKSGLRSLGFIGAMPSPEIADTGFGFIQGAEYAARESRLDDGAVSVKYRYYGTYMADSGAQIMAMDWYGVARGDDGNDSDGEAIGENESAGGVELIYAAGGELEYRVALAASLSGKSVIVYENPGAAVMKPVEASIVKNYSDAVYDCIKLFYENNFPGGEFILYGAADGGVGLRFPDAGKPMISPSDYIRTVWGLASGYIELIRVNKYPYSPPSLDILTLSKVTVIDD